MFKVVRTFAFPGALEIEKKVFGDLIEVEECPCFTEEELIKNCAEADAVICAYEPFTKRVIEALPNLKLIAFGTIGYNYADVEFAKQKNIAVSHISKYCIKEVADYTVGMMLLLNRRIVQFNHSVKEQKLWDYNLYPNIRRFEDQTIGLLGFGNIPRLVAERLKAFGCRIVAYDPYVDADLVKQQYNVEILSFDDVLAQANILSLHLPVTESTYKIVNEENIKKMRDGVMLINSARGQLVDEDAIIQGIDSGKIQFYATDVLAEEKPNLYTHPFLERENIIITPHIAFYSQESLDEATEESARNVLNFVRGNYKEAQIINGVALTI